MSEERGPSYWDCTQCVDTLVREYGKAVEIAVVPPIRRVDGAGYSSWVVVARVSPRLGVSGPTRTAQASWGKGGACATMPAALYRCLLHIIGELDTEQARAEQVAAF